MPQLSQARWSVYTLIFSVCFSIGTRAADGSGETAWSFAFQSPRLEFVQSFSSVEDLRRKPKKRSGCEWAAEVVVSQAEKQSEVARKCKKTLDIVAGKENATPEVDGGRVMIAPSRVTTDSKGRVIVTDPGIPGIHVFDIEHKKYFLIDAGAQHYFRAPNGVTTDAADNIYVSDPVLGGVVVFDQDGRFLRAMTQDKGEPFCVSPAGIAIDRQRGRIYLADTGAHYIYVLDMRGSVLRLLGTHGGGSKPGQFKSPTELALDGDRLLVLDAGNHRVQVLDLDGRFRQELPLPVAGIGTQSESTMPISVSGLSTDRTGAIYVTDADHGRVDILEAKGQPAASFAVDAPPSPTAISVDQEDRVYLLNPAQQRVEILQIHRPN